MGIAEEPSALRPGLGWLISAGEDAESHKVPTVARNRTPRVVTETKADQTAIMAVVQELTRRVAELLADGKRREAEQRVQFQEMLARLAALSDAGEPKPGPTVEIPDSFYREFGETEED